MNAGRIFAAVSIALVLLGVAGVATWFLQGQDSESQDTAAVADVAPGTLLSGSGLDQTISVLQASLEENEDSDDYASLGVAYLQKARETGDPTFYTKAEGVLDRAVELDQENFAAISSLGALALARHDFEEALELGLRAKEINPHNANNYGVIGDALLELGRYDEAFAAFQTMVDTRPDLSSFARVSYARELNGDIDGAIVAMERAREAGGGRPENVAFTAALVGNLYFGKGDLDTAEIEYQRANAIFPDYPPALAGLGRVAAAGGDYDAAIEFYRTASELFPSVAYIVALGDVYAAAGQPEKAAQQYELVSVIAALAEENGVNTDLEMALFQADHELDLEATLATARAEYERRPGVHTADVLAWTLYKSGAHQEAAGLIEEALQLGSKDALVLFHAAMIAQANGDNAGALQLLEQVAATSPHFSVLYADDAAEALAQVRILMGEDNEG